MSGKQLIAPSLVAWACKNQSTLACFGLTTRATSTIHHTSERQPHIRIISETTHKACTIWGPLKLDHTFAAAVRTRHTRVRETFTLEGNNTKITQKTISYLRVEITEATAGAKKDSYEQSRQKHHKHQLAIHMYGLTSDTSTSVNGSSIFTRIARH